MARGGPLVDTSVLIDYFSGIENRESAVLDQFLAAGPPPATCPIILQEYLQGLLDPREFTLARLDLNQTTEDWYTRLVTLSATKGLAERCFASLSMTGSSEPASEVYQSRVARFRVF